NKVRVRITAEVELYWDEEAASGGNPDPFIATVVEGLRETLLSHPDLLARAQEMVAKNTLMARFEDEERAWDRALDAVWKSVFEAMPKDVSGRFVSCDHFWGPTMLLDLLQGKVEGVRVEPVG